METNYNTLYFHFYFGPTVSKNNKTTNRRIWWDGSSCWRGGKIDFITKKLKIASNPIIENNNGRKSKYQI